MINEKEHNCLKIVIRPEDFVMGANSPIQFKAVQADGKWLPFFQFYERQLIADGDTDGCVLFSAQETFDAIIEQQIQSGAISAQTVKVFTNMGYMDSVNSTDGKPHFHSSPRFLQYLTGNGFNGNSIQDAWDVMRNYGVLPWLDLPVTPDLTVATYLVPPTQPQLDKAKLFLQAIGGKNAIQYHWIAQGSENLQGMKTALVQSPTCIGVNVGQNWNVTNPPAPMSGNNPGHCVSNFEVLFPSDAGVYDHYMPNPKRLVQWPIWYVLQPVVVVTPVATTTPPAIPPVPTLPPNPTRPQISFWLSLVTVWLNFIEKITPSGRAKLGGASRSPHWETFKKEYAVTHLPVCAVCGGTADLNLHHLKPFHVYPELELDPNNVIWLCNAKQCHIRIGHLGNFTSINPAGKEDIVIWRDKFRNRPTTSDEIKADFNK